MLSRALSDAVSDGRLFLTQVGRGPALFGALGGGHSGQWDQSCPPSPRGLSNPYMTCGKEQRKAYPKGQ